MDFDVTARNTYGFDVFWPSEERGNYSDAYYHWLEGRYPEYAAAFRVPTGATTTSAGNHGITHKGPAFYDEVMRVPLVLRWPAGLGSSQRDCRGLFEMVDLLPTLLGLSGGTPDETMVGRNLADDLLSGRDPAGRDDVFAYHDRGMAMLRTSEFKYLRYEPHGTEVLYDLTDESDGEFTNVARQERYPPALSELRERLLSRALRASASPVPKLHPY